MQDTANIDSQQELQILWTADFTDVIVDGMDVYESHNYRWLKLWNRPKEKTCYLLHDPTSSERLSKINSDPADDFIESKTMELIPEWTKMKPTALLWMGYE